MAFVYRSERNMKLDLMEENDSAPGLYELTTSFQKSEPNVAPFNSLVKRNKNSFVPKNESRKSKYLINNINYIVIRQ